MEITISDKDPSEAFDLAVSILLAIEEKLERGTGITISMVLTPNYTIQERSEVT